MRIIYWIGSGGLGHPGFFGAYGRNQNLPSGARPFLKKIWGLGLTVFLFLFSPLLAGGLKAGDDGLNLKYRVVGNQFYDQYGNSRGRIVDNRVYDRDEALQYWIEGDRVYDRKWDLKGRIEDGGIHDRYRHRNGRDGKKG
jgi:hypothetical protein